MRRRAVVTGMLSTAVCMAWAQTRVPSTGRKTTVGDWLLFLEQKTGIARQRLPPHVRVTLYSSVEWTGREAGEWGHTENRDTLLSVVGPVVSVRSEYSWVARRSGSSRRIYAHSLERVLKRTQNAEPGLLTAFGGEDEASLADLFDEEAALRALVAAEPVKGALANHTPRSWIEFGKRLYYVWDLPDRYQAEWEAIGSSFAVTDVTRDLARVQFSLDRRCSACDLGPEFEVNIPIPARTRAWFDDAKRNHTLGTDLAG